MKEEKKELSRNSNKTTTPLKCTKSKKEKEPFFTRKRVMAMRLGRSNKKNKRQRGSSKSTSTKIGNTSRKLGQASKCGK